MLETINKLSLAKFLKEEGDAKFIGSDIFENVDLITVQVLPTISFRTELKG